MVDDPFRLMLVTVPLLICGMRRVQNKLGCPYPEVAVHGDGGIGKGILASGPGAPDWHPPTADTVMTEAMRNKLAGLQRMKNRTGPTKQARRVTALRYS
jgi:hypothetical protein